jgi:hypothetical protein
VTVLDRTGLHGQVIPDLILLPDHRANAQNESPADLAWMDYAGRWGEKTAVAGFEGPTGPCFKGDQWDRPYAWGMNQPLDLETWYSNRLRVEAMDTPIQLDLVSSQEDRMRAVEQLPSLVMLHRDPRPAEVFTANIAASPNQRFDLRATAPHHPARAGG